MRLSIITVSYNNLSGLKRTAESVLKQAGGDFEWLVFDGGSSDGSKEFLLGLGERLDYFESVPDRGIYNAMNKGVRKASGEYLIFLNSGDEFAAPDVVKRALALNFGNAGVVYGDWLAIDGKKVTRKSAPGHVDFDYFCHSNLCHQAMFIRSDLLKVSEYDENIGLCADWAKWLELSGAGVSFRYIPLTVCKYELGGRSDGEDYAEHLAKIFATLPAELLPRVHISLIHKILGEKTLAGFLGYKSAKELTGFSRIKYNICKKICKGLRRTEIV